MKVKTWLLLLPVILAFAAFYGVVEIGSEGRLKSWILREKVYPGLVRASNILTDLKFRSRGYQKPKSKIVIVDIDSPALETLGRWPWHRDVISFLIEKIFAAGAKAIGLDMIFSEPDRRVPPELVDELNRHQLGEMAHKFETDRQLEDVIRLYSDRLVLAWATEVQCQPYYDKPEYCPVADPEARALYPREFEKFSLDDFVVRKSFDITQTPLVSFLTPIANIPAYTQAANHLGYINAFLDPDGYIRRSSLIVMANGKPYPSLALELAKVGLGEKLALKLDDKNRVQSLEFKNSSRTIPVSPLGVLQINFRGGNEVFPHIPILDVLSEKETIEDPLNRRLTGKSKFELLKDAYVLVGVSALGVFDMRQFPFESNAPGVDGHANILDNLLNGDSLVGSSSGNGFYWILFLMTIGMGLFASGVAKLDAIPAFLLFLISFFSLWYWDFKILFENNLNWNTSYLYLELSTVFFLGLSAKYILEEHDKKFIRNAFAKYVAPQIVESILKDPASLSLGGEKRDLSILFSDIRGFTSFCETMDAKALSAFLNDYLGIMTRLVFTNQGTLDKYIGDAVMAFWGAPLPQKSHASNACLAAIQMIQALDEHRDRFKEQYGIHVEIGIGINSGMVNVGNMGSEQNFEYTVIGDHVNLASRLEGLTKVYGVTIVTSRFTLDSIAESGEKVLPHRILDNVKVKGKKNSVQLIQIFEHPYASDGLQEFDEARALYCEKQWDEALEKFRVANVLLGTPFQIDDGPCQLYIERCESFQQSPPPPEWDGSWEMESK